MLQEAIRQYKFDTVYFLPGNNPNLKPNRTPFEFRIPMVKAMADYLSNQNGCQKTRYKVSEAYKDAPHLMASLRKLFPDLKNRTEKIPYICGTDEVIFSQDEKKLLQAFVSTENAIEFYNKFVPVINKRNGSPVPTSISIGGKKIEFDYVLIKPSPYDPQISSTLMRAGLTQPHRTLQQISSLIPRPVMNVIHSLGLYQPKTQPLKLTA